MTPIDPIEEAIFNAASQLTDATQRAKFLDQACGANQTLRARIEALLKADVRANQFLSDDPLDLARIAREIPALSPPDEPAGTMVGRYKLLEKIGEGGFGVVYLAEQKEPVKRRVALKIIKLGMDSKQVVARFEAERQALALMDHPNIARIFDAGITEAPHPASGHPLPSDGRGAGGEGIPRSAFHTPHFATGRPYFVMELVRGVPITRYCDESHLSTGERLQLFLQVCQAVQHAHQKGIIHRDLKPSNILVTVNDGVPVPKVIDFGVAKATQQELTEKTIVTQFHHFIGTPAYMSPEQAQMTSLDIDTRSDIYALGVLLYELLTGKTPFDGKELLASGLDAMRQTIREKEPLRPSKVVESMSELKGERGSAHGKQTLNSQLKSLSTDLDWIVMKCLEKDRTRRYDTANSLASDIERHLSHEPVVARPPTTVYRFQKFVRRNKLAFGAASAVALALLAGIAVSSWQAVRAIRAEQTAKQQAEIAKEQENIARLIKNFLTGPLLGSANPFVEPEPAPYKRPLLEGIAQQLEGKFAGQPQIEAEIRYALGDAFKGLAEFAKSAVQFEKCLEIRRRKLGLHHSDTLQTVAGLADADMYLGRSREAQKLLAEAISVVRNSSAEMSRGAGWVLYAQGHFLFRDGRHAEAVPYLKEGLAVLEQSEDPKNASLKGVIEVLAYATHLAGQREEARRLIAEGLRQCEIDHGAEDPMTALLQRTQADLLLQNGGWKEALPIIERSVPIHRRILGSNHVATLQAEYILAAAYDQKGDKARAAELYANLHPRWVNYFPFDHMRRQCVEIASFFVRRGNFEEAKTVYGRLRDSFDSYPPAWSWEFEILLSATAAVKGWPATAKWCEQNFDRFSDWMLVWLNKAWVFRYVGDEDSYRKVVAKVMALAGTVKGMEDQRLIVDIAGLGPVDFSAEQVQQLDSLIQTLQGALPRATPNQQVWGYRAIGQLQFRLGRFKEGLAALEYQNLTERRLQNLTGRRFARTRSLWVKTLCLQGLGNIDTARAAFEESEAILKSDSPELLGQNDEFFHVHELYSLFLRREVQAALAGVQPKP